MDMSITELGFDPQLALEVAMGIDPLPDIIDKYNLTAEEYASISNLSLFGKEVSKHREVMRQHGFDFKTKIGVMAEKALVPLWEIANDTTVDPKVRVDVLKYIIKVSGHEPKNNEDTGNNFQLIIGMPDDKEFIDVKPNKEVRSLPNDYEVFEIGQES